MELDGRVLTAHGPRALGERGTKMNRIEILEQWLGLLYVCWIAADVGADKKGRPSSVMATIPDHRTSGRNHDWTIRSKPKHLSIVVNQPRAPLRQTCRRESCLSSKPVADDNFAVVADVGPCSVHHRARFASFCSAFDDEPIETWRPKSHCQRSSPRLTRCRAEEKHRDLKQCAPRSRATTLET